MATTTLNNGPLANVAWETESAADAGIVGVVAFRLEPVNPGLIGDLTQTIGATAAGITNLPATANRCHISIETNSVRWLDNNQTPTASIGHLLVPPSGDAVYLMVEGRTRLTNFKMIRAGAADATAHYTFYL